MLYLLLIDVKMSKIESILTSMPRIKFLLSRVEHDKRFYNLATRTLPPVHIPSFIKLACLSQDADFSKDSQID